MIIMTKIDDKFIKTQIDAVWHSPYKEKKNNEIRRTKFTNIEDRAYHKYLQ